MIKNHCGRRKLQILIIFFLILESYARNKFEKRIEYCSTDVCLKTSQRIREFIDENIDPCKDIYQYACGGWLKEQQNQEKSGIWQQAESTVYEQLLNNLENLELNVLDDSRSDRYAMYLFRECLDVSRNTPEKDWAMIQDLIIYLFQDLDEWKWDQVFINLWTRMGDTPFFKLSIASFCFSLSSMRKASYPLSPVDWRNSISTSQIQSWKSTASGLFERITSR